MHKQRLLITGASGFLGWNVCQLLKNEWQITGTAYTHPLSINGVDITVIDLTNTSEIKQLFDSCRPDAVIHCAAAANPAFCQLHSDIAAAININASISIAELCEKMKTPLIFTSTDLVFDGNKGSYKEDDLPLPISIYGQQKFETEKRIQEIYKDITICRMPLMFGQSSPTSTSFLQPMLEKLKRKESLTLFTNEKRSVLSAVRAARGLNLILRKKLSGIFHLGGDDHLSRYNFGILLCKLLNINTDQIEGCLQSDIKMAAPRPANVTLNNDKVKAAGFIPGDLQEELMGILKTV